MKVLIAQSCPTLCDPMNCSQSGSSVHRIPRQHYWSNSFPSPGKLPDPGIKPESPALQEDYHLNYQGSPIKKMKVLCTI